MKEIFGKGVTAVLFGLVALVVVHNLPTIQTVPVAISHTHAVEIQKAPKVEVQPISIDHNLKPSPNDPIRVAPIEIDHHVRPGLFPPRRGEDTKYAALGWTTHNGFGNCSITIIGPRASDGYYYALFSRHCCDTDYTGFAVTVGHLKNHPVRIAARWKRADIALIQIDTKEDLDYALVSPSAPKKGQSVWHRGHGRDKPDNLETGEVTDPGSKDGGQAHTVFLSPGDSGSGLFVFDRGRDGKSLLVGVNHSYWNGSYYATSHAEVRDFLDWCHPDRNLTKKPYVDGGYWAPISSKKPGPPKDKAR